MKIVFSADFHTDGDFGFHNFDELFDKNNRLYEGAKIGYFSSRDGENISVYLTATGEANACRWAVRDLLEEMMCSISTCKYYLVKEIYDSLYYFYDGLWGDMNQDKKAFMSGNYDGTYLTLYMRENEHIKE